MERTQDLITAAALPYSIVSIPDAYTSERWRTSLPALPASPPRYAHR